MFGNKDPSASKSRGLSPEVLAAAKKKFNEAKSELVLRFSGDNKHVTFNVWDCGGQPVFNAMHSLFMTGATQDGGEGDGDDGGSTPNTHKRYTGALAVFAVVFNIRHLVSARTQQECLHFLSYWLNQIAVQAPGAPVLLIGTHKDTVTTKDVGLAQKLVRRHVKQLYMYSRLNIVRPTAGMDKGKATGGVGVGGLGGGPTPWFFPVDNTARETRDGKIVASDPAVHAIKNTLEEVVRGDQRLIEGLDGKPTSYLDFRMPLQCLLLLETLKDQYGRVCSRKV